MNYLSEVLEKKEYLRERKLFRYVDKLIAAWEKIYEFTRKMNSGLELKRNIFSKLGGVFSCILFFGTIIIMLWQVFGGMILIGSFSAVCQRMFTIIDLLANEVTRNMYAVVKDGKYLNDIKTFFSLPEEDSRGNKCEHTKNLEYFQKLEFKNVSFMYPETDKYVLKNLSFIMEHGKTYALVGSNSAGKSTIIKLMLGLYQNYEGTILINDLDIRMVSLERLRHFFSVVFQDYARYELTVQDNVELSKNLVENYDIEQVLKEVNLYEKIQSLPNGISNYIGRLYQDSVDLSGGEWQKLAVARCLANQAPIRILDEPTSALDPTYELEFFNTFHSLNRNKTMILVSHRLGSTRFADTILVLKKGTIVEKGNFDELMHMEGEYYGMFKEQQKWYL